MPGGGYQDPAYQAQDYTYGQHDARSAFGNAMMEKAPYVARRNVGICGVRVPPLAAGYIVCLFSVIEGALLLLRGAPAGLLDEAHNPFAAAQNFLLTACGTGDLIVAILGGLGLWMSRNLLPSTIMWLFRLQEWHGPLSSRLVMILFVWRVFVIIATAPWVGVALAFAPSSFDKGAFMFFTCLYLFASLYFVWLMMAVYPAAVDGSVEMQNELDAPGFGMAERQFIVGEDAQQLEIHLRSRWDHDRIFCCLPLEPVICLYAYLLCIFCIWHFIRGELGAWAVFLSAPKVSTTAGLERVLLVLAALTSLSGALAITFHRDRARSPSYEKRSTSALLLFFVTNFLRIALCMPITGMALVALNICGVYVRGLASVSLKGSAGTTMQCSGEDWRRLGFIIAIAAVDLYLAWGVFRLWRQYRFASPVGSKRLSYGALGEQAPVHEL
eukprot:TRINITY_DN57735_c0_g1_i1.p1 TRINITY_DN57735_c0_g1~~TRINITY_DN57735_c0_g1_i1.p1  ORF type:complete len:441 (+),score=55.81 TRINITY_DN57735_c0_g1_i1:152-1474(+)